MSIITKIKCLIGRHDYSRIAHVSPSSDHIGCIACGKQWGINHDARAILPWAEVRGLYISRGYDERHVVREWHARHKPQPAKLRLVTNDNLVMPEIAERNCSFHRNLPDEIAGDMS